VTYSNTQPWLKLNVISGSTPLTFTVTADPTGLAAGAHQASIAAASAGASNSPLSVPVTFTIGAQTAPSSVISALMHGASYLAGPIAPNEFLTAFGTFPGCDSSPAQVTVGAAPAQTFYSSATQVNLLVPSQVPAGSQSNVQVSCPGSAAVPFSVSLAGGRGSGRRLQKNQLHSAARQFLAQQDLIGVLSARPIWRVDQHRGDLALRRQIA
jgi:hypothetical protein